MLAGTPTGPVRPRQDFQSVHYQVPRPLFTEVNGQPQVQFTIDPAVLAQQLNRNTALFLSAATFELEGRTQSQEVELQIATSGHYTNQLGQNVFRFVSQPVSTTNDGPGSRSDGERQGNGAAQRLCLLLAGRLFVAADG